MIGTITTPAIEARPLATSIDQEIKQYSVWLFDSELQRWVQTKVRGSEVDCEYWIHEWKKDPNIGEAVSWPYDSSYDEAEPDDGCFGAAAPSASDSVHR